MITSEFLRCDGCGQASSPEHVARRLQRLEWSTRFRPVHIGTLLLGAFSPQQDAEYFYTPAGLREGEARFVLEACGISAVAKPFDTVLAEFQRGGFFQAYVLECPVDDTASQDVAELLGQQLVSAMTRIRRSLRPKRLAVISTSLSPFLASLQAGNLGCELLLNDGKPFALEHCAGAARLSEALRIERSSRSTAV